MGFRFFGFLAIFKIEKIYKYVSLKSVCISEYRLQAYADVLQGPSDATRYPRIFHTGKYLHSAKNTDPNQSLKVKKVR